MSYVLVVSQFIIDCKCVKVLLRWHCINLFRVLPGNESPDCTWMPVCDVALGEGPIRQLSCLGGFLLQVLFYDLTAEI